MNSNRKFYLASRSPRRRELLLQMGINFDVLDVDHQEIIKDNEYYQDYSERITQEKLDTAWHSIEENDIERRPVICADTEVILNGHILGKPSSRQDAYNMINAYSGNSHIVITTVGIKYFEKFYVETCKTIVYFDDIPNSDIEFYLDTRDYQDKSGGYGIQSYIGQFIKSIDGCYFSVMGLPLNLTRKLINIL